MILFDLRCANGHRFETWFKDSGKYEELKAKGAITCAFCGDTCVEKALMAPAIRTRRAADPAPVQPPAPAAAKGAPAAAADQAITPAATIPVDPQKLAEAMQMLRQVQSHIEKTFDHVGKRFAEEARKIHYGETEKRNIYGEASQGEAESLRDEGIEIAQVPWLPRHDS